MTPTALRRNRAFARPLPPGYRRCRTCLCARPASGLLTRMGNLSTRCGRCRHIRERCDKANLARYFSTPKGRRVRRAHLRAFRAAKPLNLTLYDFRRHLDLAWRPGKQNVRRFLGSVGHIPTTECGVCKKRDGLLAFWPDYAEPCTFINLCAIHRKVRAVEDPRTDEQITASLASAHERMLEVRAALNAMERGE